MKTGKKQVSFIASKKTIQPQQVRFNTKEGMVSFTAKKNVIKPQVVNFEVKIRRKK